MPNVMQLLPMLEPEEMTYIQGLIKDMNDNQAQQFANIYMNRRKDTQTILIAAVVGFLGIAGIQRFLTNQTGMGLLYLFTMGLCFIGTIIDLVNHRTLTFDYNIQMAHQTAALVRSVS
ncbi:MAG: TM2 domain-containing protein [Ignavibacteriales bacterium]|nr:TM2 domain-containing protein [Ignavibacteriales bacterium]